MQRRKGVEWIQAALARGSVRRPVRRQPGDPTGPNIIGATGGSGTRVFGRIARRGGMFIGTNVNESEDALDFAAYGHRWIDTYIMRGAIPLSHPVRAAMVAELGSLVATHLATLRGMPQPWGWKIPTNIYLLPFLVEQFPELHFLHVVRDGRDMAFSTNQNQLRNHGHILVADAEAALDQPIRSILLWNRINLMAAEYGEKHMRGRYLRVRFEDVCADPVPVVADVLEFFHLAGDPQEIARMEVRKPPSVGRWCNEDPATIAELERAGKPALRKFGYTHR